MYGRNSGSTQTAAVPPASARAPQYRGVVQSRLVQATTMAATADHQRRQNRVVTRRRRLRRDDESQHGPARAVGRSASR